MTVICCKSRREKGVLCFGKRGKLNPRFVGPFRIIERICKPAYRLELPEELSGIHNVFLVGYLRKCLVDTDAVVPLTDVRIDDKLRYKEEPESILDEKITKLRNKEIIMVLVKWKHH